MDQYIRDFINNETYTVELNDESEYEKIKIVDSNSKKFSMFHVNIRSITKNMNEMSILLDKFRYNFDCIILTETFQINDPSFYHIEGFEIIYNAGNINKNDGVVMYIRNTHNYKVDIINAGNIKIIKTEINYLGKTIIVSALYRPPSTCPYEFITHLRQYITEHTSNENFHFIVGDINIDIKSDKDYCQDYLNLMGVEGFRSLINRYTRELNETKSCIDHIFLKNREEVNIEAYLVKNGITDHFPIIAKIEIKNYNYTVTKNEKKKIIKLNERKLLDIIKTENWNTIYQTDDLERATNIFVGNIQKAIDRATTEVIIKKTQRKRNPWITAGLLKSVQNKERLYKTMIADPTDIQAATDYKKHKNKLQELIRITKNNYYKEQIQKNKYNCQTLWKVVNDYTKRKKTVDEIKDIKVYEKTISDKKEMANIFNQFYSEIGREMAQKIIKPNISVVKNPTCNKSIFLYPANSEEVANYIRELKPHKSPGLDNIKSETLKTISDHIKEPFTYIINKILETGKFPTIFKVAVIKPVYKKGDKCNVTNYRPLSLISNLAKIVEKIIKCRIISFLNNYNLLSNKQFGFKQNVSTEDAISYLTNNIYRALDESMPTLCVFLDLQKAFDTVSHKHLIDTVEDIGIRSTALRLIESYLTGRTQYVKIDGCLSNPMPVTYGVPQGTVLGPILFLIYINGLFNIETVGCISSFADDTVILYTANTWAELKIKAEEDLKKIKTWFDEKYLTINFSKTKYIPFTCYKTNIPFDDISFTINNTEYVIESTENIKYLGIEIDRYLKWDIHVSYVVKKLRSLLFKFKQLKQILDLKEIKLLYHSLVESHLQYGITGWGGVLKQHVKNLEITQKYFLKIMLNKVRTYPSNDLYNESKVLDIRQLYFNKILALQYKNRNHLKNLEHNYLTRYKKTREVQVERANKTIGQRSVNFMAPRIFSCLPQKTKNLNNINLFKRHVKNWILNTPRHLFHDFLELKIAKI